MFSGSMVAIVTPFQNGKVDYRTLDELVDFQLESGTDGIVPVGTTGESPTLTPDEHKKVIERVVKAVGGMVPVIAGTGSNSTAEAIELTEAESVFVCTDSDDDLAYIRARAIEAGEEKPLAIEGHADNFPIKSPIYPSNWELSSSRATAVLRHLIEQYKIPANRLMAVGYSDTRPLVANDTPENRAKNRRVEFHFKKDSEKE